MTAAATVVLAQEATQNPLLPAVYDIVWSLVIFAIIAGVLGWYAVPRLTKVLDERSERIEGGLRLAEEAKAEAADARERVEAEIAQARRESAAIRERAGEEGKQIVAEAQRKAQAEAERISANAHRQIEADRQAAQISLRSDVGMLATDLASRIVGESLTDQALQSRVIDRFLDDLDGQVAGDRSGAGAREA